MTPLADTRKRQTKGEKTRQAIFATATQILCEQGYQGLTIAALAQGAGIQRNSFYTHFRDLREIIDGLSLQVLNDIGRRTFPLASCDANVPSVVLSRLQFALSLRDTDPPTASVVSELYVNHAATANEVHRRLSLDIAADRRRKVSGMTHREAKVAAILLAAGLMELLRRPAPAGAVADRVFLELVSRLCKLSQVGGD